MSITIEDTLKRELEAIVPKGERAAFVSKAIQKAIQDWYKQRALEKILNFKPYKIDKNSIDILHEVREQRIEQIIDASKG